MFEALAELAADALTECDSLGLTPIGAGISVPGTVEAQTGTLIHAPNLGWDEVPVAETLRHALGDPPFAIKVGNDANLAALGELESGALRGVRDGLLIYGNIGIGGAVIVDGAIFPGSDGFAGEIGHIPVRPFDGEECRCGGRGCLETLAGQEAIARRVGIQGTRSETSSPAILVAERAQEGDAEVIAALDEVAEILGICIAAVVSIVNPAARRPGRDARDALAVAAAGRARRRRPARDGRSDGRRDRRFATRRRGSYQRGRRARLTQRAERSHSRAAARSFALRHA